MTLGAEGRRDDPGVSVRPGLWVLKVSVPDRRVVGVWEVSPAYTLPEGTR